MNDKAYSYGEDGAYIDSTCYALCVIEAFERDKKEAPEIIEWLIQRYAAASAYLLAHS